MRELLAFAGVAAIIVVLPGPDMALVLRNGIASGRRAALETAVGINAGLLVWALAAALGIAALLSASATAFTALELAGAAYLVWLGVRALRDAWRGASTLPGTAARSPRGRSESAFRQGLLSNLLNPKIALVTSRDPDRYSSRKRGPFQFRRSLACPSRAVARSQWRLDICRYPSSPMNASQSWWRRSRLLDLSQRATVAISLVLTIGLFAVWAAEASVAEHSMLLLAVPVALCAVGFGVRGGLLVAAFGIALTLVWYLDGDMGLGPVAYAWQASSLVVVGVFVGHFADERRRPERQIARHEELSIDLICTADFDGYFTRVNPAWNRVLGYEHDDLLRRPFIDFVHPDDRAATIAEAERQTEAGEEVLRFENRYRHRDGSYRWLEWTSRPDPELREQAPRACG